MEKIPIDGLGLRLRLDSIYLFLETKIEKEQEAGAIEQGPIERSSRVLGDVKENLAQSGGVIACAL